MTDVEPLKLNIVGLIVPEGETYPRIIPNRKYWYEFNGKILRANWFPIS